MIRGMKRCLKLNETQFHVNEQEKEKKKMWKFNNDWIYLQLLYEVVFWSNVLNIDTCYKIIQYFSSRNLLTKIITTHKWISKSIFEISMIKCMRNVYFHKKKKRQIFEKAYEEIIEIRMKIDSSENALYRRL